MKRELKDLVVLLVLVGGVSLLMATEEKIAHEKPRKPFRDRVWTEIAFEQADLQGVDRCTVWAVNQVESRGGKYMRSSVGALGHMQLMPATARGECGITTDEDRLEPEFNIYCGVKYLKKMQRRFGFWRGLQAYNSGPGRIGKSRENREFPHKVVKEMKRCKAQREQA